MLDSEVVRKEVICGERSIGNGVVDEDDEAAPARRTGMVLAKSGVVGKFVEIAGRT